MCGRFTLTCNSEIIAETFGVADVPEISPRYNIAPSTMIGTIVGEGSGADRRFQSMKWGLIPSWAKDDKNASKLINARAETLTEKPSFRNAFKHRRCLIPADGFYEWKTEGKSKQPYYFRRKNRHPFAFAGLWERWQSPNGTLISCTIITGEANEIMRPIHHRRPIILSPEDYDRWLDPNLAGEDLMTCLQTYDGGEMELFPVSKQVNNPANQGSELIAVIAGGIKKVEGEAI